MQGGAVAAGLPAGLHRVPDQPASQRRKALGAVDYMLDALSLFRMGLRATARGNAGAVGDGDPQVLRRREQEGPGGCLLRHCDDRGGWTAADGALHPCGPPMLRPGAPDVPAAELDHHVRRVRHPRGRCRLRTQPPRVPRGADAAADREVGEHRGRRSVALAPSRVPLLCRHRSRPGVRAVRAPRVRAVHAPDRHGAQQAARGPRGGHRERPHRVFAGPDLGHGRRPRILHRIPRRTDKLAAAFPGLLPALGARRPPERLCSHGGPVQVGGAAPPALPPYDHVPPPAEHRSGLCLGLQQRHLGNGAPRDALRPRDRVRGPGADHGADQPDGASEAQPRAAPEHGHHHRALRPHVPRHRRGRAPPVCRALVHGVGEDEGRHGEGARVPRDGQDGPRQPPGVSGRVRVPLRSAGLVGHGQDAPGPARPAGADAGVVQAELAAGGGVGNDLRTGAPASARSPHEQVLPLARLSQLGVRLKSTGG
mmetsp:Transcript_25135/g.59956  ORF Transcript_25135/g.59956 Transcript_25135/m.59956 type:complete len:481 (+) Transcript_25135:1345-2787(+)